MTLKLRGRGSGATEFGESLPIVFTRLESRSSETHRNVWSPSYTKTTL